MSFRNTIVPTLALFGSFSTLLCCALPALFVSLGAGAALIGVVSTFPQLIWLSEHKVGLFTFSGVMIVISGTTRYLSRNAPCPVDADRAKACLRLRRISLGFFYVSVGLYLIGFYFAFVARYLVG